jgi:hypothetical protein
MLISLHRAGNIQKKLDDSTILRRFQGMKTRKMNLPRSLPSLGIYRAMFKFFSTKSLFA